MASPKSGKFGDIKMSTGAQIAECLGWKASMKSNNPAFCTNVTPGWKRRVAGVADSEISFKMLDNPELYFTIGSAVSINLYTSAAFLWTQVPVLIDDYTLETDIDNGSPLSWDVKASGNGAPVPWPPATGK
jgi:hypothetical protein